MAPKVLVVCLGNTCRSPMGEAVLRKIAKDRDIDIFVDSAGTAAYHIGAKPNERTTATCVKLLRPAGLKEVSVGSVEQFQGQERKVIIFATTRSNSEADKRKAMGFLQNRQRMNVAITRAQSLLIVVGDPEVLGKDELWRTFLNYATLREGWTGKTLGWDPETEVLVPGYEVIPRVGGVVHGESYMDGRSENIHRYLPLFEEAGEDRRATSV